MAKVIYFNKKIDNNDSSLLKFSKNQDNHLNKDLKKIEFLSRDILKKLSENDKVSNFIVFGLNKKNLKIFLKKNKANILNKKLKNIKKKIKVIKINKK